MGWDDGLINEMASREESTPGRVLTYADAINEALMEALQRDKDTFLYGQGVPDPSGYWGCTTGLLEKFGSKRVFDTPLSEEAMQGVAVGAAISGKRPILFHNRPDFILLSMNQLVTHASKLSYMDNGQTKVPIVVWAAIGRGWGSGAQHSQAIQGMLLGVPGIKIVMPSTPADAKGLLISAIEDNNPVLVFEHRFCMRKRGHVPTEYYSIPFGSGVYRHRGSDATIVGTSHALDVAMDAVEKFRLDCDVIDLRTVKPWDKEIVFESLSTTNRLLVVDTGWEIGGVCAEIMATVAERMRIPMRRVGLPDCPTPAGYTLEQFFYPDAERVKREVEFLINS